MRPYDVSKKGKIFTFSIIHDAPEANRDLKPYAVAMVRTDDGLLISGQLTDVDLAQIEIGMRVRAVLRKLGDAGPSGIIHYGFKFVPDL